MSLKPVALGGRVIDSDFRGIVSVILTNHSNKIDNIEQGNRIAQMLFLKEEDVDFIEVDELDETERGVNGFGSTGKLKKMEKVVIEEFDCCHSFIESCVCFILPLNERIFVHVTHLVGGGKFFIFVSYDKEQLNTKINQFITDIIKESKNWDDLRKYWNVNEPLVEGYENPEWKLFPYGITFTF